MEIRRAIIILGIFWAALCGLAACSDQVSNWPSNRFESATWMQTKQGERYVFAGDLLKRNVLLGLTRNEVVELLGVPDSEPEGESYITYIVKADHGVVHLLDVRFNKSAPIVVEEVLIRSD